MQSTDVADQDKLRSLNDDVLQAVFEALRPRGGLRRLSTTCKWVRRACMPVLFRNCVVRSSRLDSDLENPRPVFLPQSLWPFVRVLDFRGPFSRNDLPWHYVNEHSLSDPEWEPYCALRLTSAQILGRFIEEALASMSSLRSINLSTPIMYPRNLWDPNDVPGVSWYLLAAILSTPHLRRITISGTLLHPADDLLRDYALPKLAPLTSFRYMDPEERQNPRSSDMENKALQRILDGLHADLEQLTLRSDTAPLHAMRLWEWPRLRVLELRGERPLSRPQAPAFPLVEVLERTPRLRTLSLYFAEPSGSPPPPIWPADRGSIKDHHGRLVSVWRDLEELTVTHPNPDDEFYAHLPIVMRRLTLRCWPRYYKHDTLLDNFKRVAGLNWIPLPLRGSEMLNVLRKSSMPNLTCLEVEYRAGGGDDGVFRAAREEEIPVTDIARALAPLSRLRLLMLHLDFPDLPAVATTSEYGRRTFPHRSEQGQWRLTSVEEDFFPTIVSAADVFAKTLSAALKHVCFLVPQLQWRHWRTFRIVHKGRAVVAEYLDLVPTGTEVLGFSIEYDH